MRKIIFAILILVLVPKILAQTNDVTDAVNVKVICKGNSETAAITEGLRSALTQTAGVFISSNTTIINDQMTNDQTTMINNGSIIGYKVIEKLVLDDQYTLTLDVAVSVNKLGSFVKNSGGETELQGGLFAANIKLNELNENAEKQSIKDLLEISNTLINKSFNYNIVNGEPTNVGGKWSVPLRINIIKNENWENFIKFFYGTLNQIGMIDSEIDKYIKLNLPIYVLGLFDNRNLTHSTPTILFKHQFDKLDYLKTIQKKQYQFDYYLFERVVNADKRLVYLSNDIKDALGAQSKFLSLQDAWGDHSTFEPYLGTVNRTGTYNKIVFRKKESFEMMMDFVVNLHQNIRNVEIDNGISKFNLKLENLGYTRDTRADNYQNLREISCFPISVFSPYKYAFFTGTSGDINLANNGGRQIEGLNNLNLERWPNYRFWNVGPQILKNKTWETRMIEQRRTDGGFQFGLFSDSLINNDPGVNGTEGRNYSKSYFDLVFGNFVLYHADIQKLQTLYVSGQGYEKVSHFPLQLSMVGDDKNVVFSFSVDNIVSTSDIAKVSKYKVDQPK